MLQINLDCQFDEFRLRVDQQLPSDQIIGLFGASGSGKSRLIRQLLGFDRQYQHNCHIKFNQQTWHQTDPACYLPTQKRGIGYLPQSIDLFPHLSVKNNIFLSYDSFERNQSSSTFNEDWIKEIMLQLELNKLLDKMPQQLSGGQQQRVALARAILASSKLLILDEPLSAIGEDHKPQVMRLLKHLRNELRIPIIFSSHNRFEHAFLSDYLVTFNAGAINQSGSYQSIATDINGDFSQMNDAINHITAKVIQFENEYSVNCLEKNGQQLWAGNQPLEKDSLVNLEIRAQDISIFLSQSDRSSILNSLEVKIIDIEEISRHQIIIKLALEDCFLIAFITKKSLVALGLKKDQNVYAKFKSVSVLPISL